MLRFTIEDAHAMVLALWQEVELPNESLADFVKNRICGYHHNQGSPTAYPNLSDNTMEMVENLDKADAEQLLSRLEYALRYQEAFPERAPVYALRAAELIHVEEYPPIFAADTAA